MSRKRKILYILGVVVLGSGAGFYAFLRHMFQVQAVAVAEWDAAGATVFGRPSSFLKIWFFAYECG